MDNVQTRARARVPANPPASNRLVTSGSFEAAARCLLTARLIILHGGT